MSIMTDRRGRTDATELSRRWPLSRGAAKGAFEVTGVSTLSFAAGMVLLGLIWALVSAFRTELPGPLPTMGTFWDLVSDPLYDNGPNDKGIGLQLWASLGRVFTGFAIGTAVAIPLGILLGANRYIRRVIDPVVQLLRPVSPLAWFPIGLVTFQSAPHAAVFVVAITCLWPTVINTAFGVGTIPQSHKNTAAVFQFTRWKYLTRIVLPFAMPHILTGMRLSMGIAWVVIVAAEMLSGGSGIGFFVWDSWNALDLEKCMSAIILIGIVGLLLDRAFALVARRFNYVEVP